ncbi:hypothetical protein N8I77_009541 [Diaporthe amygdali]|uniref:FAD-binding domain-containing protein n=1 Tax=Phomopsis amygdali TaxID=1214568 RepID=A0AAD9SBD1_PHOAM|nr:hypothetical protein N8I77_009541 [Diaporthe amygdali]
MFSMKLAKLLHEGPEVIRKKFDTNSSRSIDTSNKYYSDDSIHSRNQQVIPIDTNESNADSHRADPTTHIPSITPNDNDVPLILSSSAKSDAYIDIPHSVPVLDLHPLRANPIAWATPIGTSAQTHVQNYPQTRAMKPATFRVIIVGGGPNGLALAHALHLTGIDYTLLEREPTILTDDGTPLALWPHSVRILDQLGLLDEARKHCVAMHTKHNHRADGSLRDSSDVFVRIEENHGHPWMLLDRATLLRMMWEALPEREERVYPGMEVVSVETHATGVRVTCADGCVEDGSTVVGCDGVHSLVREAVLDLRAAKKKIANRLSLTSHGSGGGNGGKVDNPMMAKYYGLIGSVSLMDGLDPGTCYETRSDPKGKTFQILAGEDMAYFIVYIRLEKPSGERTIYTDQDAEQLASTLAEHPVTDKVKFSGLWRAKRNFKMLDFHEGLAKKWYHKRVVLVSDAAHSSRPHFGLGVNTGWQGVVELTNGLRRLLLRTDGGYAPDTASIKRVFGEYQARREDLARSAAQLSALYARAVAGQGLRSRFCDWAVPAIAGDIVRSGITLDFVDKGSYREGKGKWIHPRRRAGAASTDEAEERMGRLVWVYPGIPISIRAT